MGGTGSTEWGSVPMLATMSETAAGSVPTPEGNPRQELRERVTLVGFVIVATVATVAWLTLLAWLALEGLRELGV
jgi:hypothetical protein